MCARGGANSQSKDWRKAVFIFNPDSEAIVSGETNISNATKIL